MPKQKRNLPAWFKCIPSPTGDYSKDIDAGMSCAAEIFEMVRRDRAPWLVGWVVVEMNNRLPEGEHDKGILVGFCGAVGRRLVDGVYSADAREAA